MPWLETCWNSLLSLFVTLSTHPSVLLNEMPRGTAVLGEMPQGWRGVRLWGLPNTRSGWGIGLGQPRGATSRSPSNISRKRMGWNLMFSVLLLYALICMLVLWPSLLHFSLFQKQINNSCHVLFFLSSFFPSGNWMFSVQISSNPI